MDEIVKKIAALGLPGVILVITMASSGWAGSCSYAIIAALVGLGGPFGITGGLGVLGMMTLVGEDLAGYGIEAILKGIYVERSKTESVKFLLKEIKDLPITDKLKLKLKSLLSSQISSASQKAQSSKNIEISAE